MSEFTVDLFTEDWAHENLVRALLLRVAREEDKRIVVQARSVRGGHGRVLSELDLYQKIVMPQGHYPDLLVVCIDANCARVVQAREQIKSHIANTIADRTVVACPDPHVERWYLADPDSFHSVVGIRPDVGRKKCERGRYKTILSRAIRDAGHPLTLGGIEFAPEIAEAMDLFRACKSDASLKHFLAEVRGRLRTL